MGYSNHREIIMKRNIFLLFLSVVLSCFFLSINHIEASDLTGNDISSKIEKNSSGDYSLTIKNNGSGTIKNIEGKTNIPIGLVKNSKVSQSEWKIASLKKGESKKVSLTLKNKNTLFSNKFKSIILVIVLVAIIFILLLLVIRKKYILFFSTLILSVCVPLISAYSSSHKSTIKFETPYIFQENHYVFETKMSFESVTSAANNKVYPQSSSEDQSNFNLGIGHQKKEQSHSSNDWYKTSQLNSPNSVTSKKDSNRRFKVIKEGQLQSQLTANVEKSSNPLINPSNPNKANKQTDINKPLDSNEITITGTAYDDDKNAITNQKISVIDKTKTATVTTDSTGYFYTKIKRSEDYTFQYRNNLSVKVNVVDNKNFHVDNEVGSIDLGKKISTNGNSFVKLNISTIYFDDTTSVTQKGNDIIFDNDPKVNVGDVVVIPNGGDFGNGYSLKINHIVRHEGQTIVEGTQPKILEIFQQIHSGSDGIAFGKPKVQFDNGVSLTSLKSVNYNLQQSLYRTSKIKTNQKLTRSTIQPLAANSVVSAKIFNYSTTIDPKEKLSNISNLKSLMSNIDEMKLVYNTSLTGSIDVSILENKQNINLDSKTSVDANLKLIKKSDFSKSFNTRLGNITVPTEIPFVTVNIPIDLVGSFKADGSMEISMKASASKDVGFNFQNNQLTTSGLDDNIDSSFNVSGSMKGHINSELGLSPALSLNVLSQSMAEIRAQVGANYALNSELNLGIGSKDSDNKLNLNADSSVNAYGDIKVDSPLIGEVLGNKGILYQKRITKNLQKTKDMQIKKIGSSTSSKKIYVTPGEHVELTATDSDGNDMPSNSSFAMLPLYLLNTAIKDVHQTANGIGFTVNDDATVGSKVTMKAFQLMDYILISGQTQFDIIIGNEPHSGQLTGTVNDAVSDQPVSGAQLEFIDSTNEMVKTVSTNQEGNYSTSLVEGTYKVIISAKNYIQEINHVTIHEGSTTYDSKLKLIDTSHAGTGNASGKINDAINANVLQDVQLSFRKGRNTTQGDIISSVKTDAQGTYKVSLPGGNYTAEMFKDGYFQGFLNITVVGGIESDNQNAVLTPNQLTSNQYRVVLTWGENPRDIDTHFVGNTTNEYSGFNLFFQNKNINDSMTEAHLDRDDTDSFGPETLTINRLSTSVDYQYNIEYYAGIGTLSSSQAKVQVYSDKGLIYTFDVPSQSGAKWEVFRISSGKIIPLNRMAE